MRVLWLSHLIPYPPKGGVLQRAYNMLNEMAKYHTVDLVAFNQPDLLAPLYSNLEEGVLDAKQALSSVCENVAFFEIDSVKGCMGKGRLALQSLVSKDPYNINWLKSRKYGEYVQDIISKYEYDLVHLDTISLIPYLNYTKDIPTVLDHHNIESHMLQRRAGNESNKLKKWYFKQEGDRLEEVEKTICPNVDLNITCSEIDAKRLKEIAPGSRVEEVPNGVDIDYFKRTREYTSNPALIFVGTLSWYPNIEAVRFIAEHLWPKLKSSIPGITFHIVGANPPGELLALSKSDTHFKVHGFVDDVREYMQKAAIYVCPIQDGGGTKLKILDALAMEMPIVAHPIACEGIRVEPGNNVIFAKTLDEYLAAISNLLNNPDRRAQIGRNARTLIETEYSYEIIGRRMSDLYENVVQSFNKARN